MIVRSMASSSAGRQLWATAVVAGSSRSSSLWLRQQQSFCRGTLMVGRITTAAAAAAATTCSSSSTNIMQSAWRRSFSSPAGSVSDDPHDESSSSLFHQTTRRQKVRNVAVIAHVDHGKTTLVDQLLKAADKDAAMTERLLDSGDLEKERGITITSKVTRIHLLPNNVTINCADTPGHSDFSGEVDRFLSLSDGFILVVDAAEGPKSQTKYVLSRALALGLKPVVVFNKCDRPDAIAQIDSGATEAKLLELFETLNATDEQLDHLTLYASAREGWVTEDPLEALELTETGLTDSGAHGMRRLLEHVLEEIPEPHTRYYEPEPAVDDKSAQEATFFAADKFSMAAVTVGNDQYLGRTCTGRITSGSIGVDDGVAVLPRDAKNSNDPGTLSAPSNVAGVFVFKGISRVPLEGRAYAGDIVTLAGVPASIAVGDTLTGAGNPVPEPIQTPPLAPPTLSMDFGANDGPLAGKEGKEVTSSKIRQRLMAEADNNVTLRIEPSPNDAEKTVVFARGELQLGILIETMRREGFEMVISPPTIVTKTCPETGKTLEPYEEVMVDVDSEYSGAVISALTGDRRGVMVEMSESANGKCQIVFEVPSRGLLGFNSEIATATRGSAVVNHLYLEDREQRDLGAGLAKGKLVSTEAGKATAYALDSIVARGTLFVKPGETVYGGMVIGENAKSGDLEVNCVRAKAATNIRTQNKDERSSLPPPKDFTIEEYIGYMAPDEVLEITPKSVRLRKLFLDPGERARARKGRRQNSRAGRK